MNAFPKRALVFPCGSEIGLELGRSLSVSAHVVLFGASSVADHGEFAFSRYIRGLPTADDPAFPDAFNRALGENAIGYVFPAHDDVLTLLARLQDDGALAAEALVPDSRTASLCRSKRATYARFSGLLRTPAIYAMETLGEASYPVFLKPDAGQGGKGTFLARDARAARERLREYPGHLALEYFSGREYTVDCFTDRRGALRFCSPRLRSRVANGISVRTEPVESPALVRMAETVNRELAMRGAWFLQAREDGNGEPGLLEIAPRIAGASGIQRARGVNLALLSLYDRMDVDVEIAATLGEDVVMDRALAGKYAIPVAYDTLYIDLDDTLVVRGGVNLDAVRLVYQCLNRGIRVVLLTRRRGDVGAILRRRRLAGLFDLVVEAPDDAPKSDFIESEGENAIFVDDSFAEREDVRRKTGIPVFDPSAIEALLD